MFSTESAGALSPSMTVQNSALSNRPHEPTADVGQSRLSHSPQMSIDDAIAAAERGMTLAIDKAHRTGPTFSERASAAILAQLRTVGECSGEELTDIARAHGAVPTDDRAFGSVFKSLSRKGLIRQAGFCLRRKGHATAGGRVWALVSEAERLDEGIDYFAAQGAIAAGRVNGA